VQHGRCELGQPRHRAGRERLAGLSLSRPRRGLTARAGRALRRAAGGRCRPSRRRRRGSGGSSTPPPTARAPDRRAGPSPIAAGGGRGGASRSPRSSPGTRARPQATSASRDGRALRSQSADRAPRRAPGKPPGARHAELLPVTRQQVQALLEVLAHLPDRRCPTAGKRLEHERPPMCISALSSACSSSRNVASSAVSWSLAAIAAPRVALGLGSRYALRRRCHRWMIAPRCVGTTRIRLVGAARARVPTRRVR
jgi:hypothetical protein